MKAPPEAQPDSSDEDEYRYKLPRTRVPEPIIRGVKGWLTSEGWQVIRIHYTCDPERATEDWKQEQVQGYRGGLEGRGWQREMEIDFGSYAGDPVYSQFDSERSVARVKYNPHLPLWRAWDFGYRNPAVTFYQLWPDDTLVMLREIFPTLDKEKLPGIKTDDLAKLVIYLTDKWFPEAQDIAETAGVYDFCDPAGKQKKETSDFSSVEILQRNGIEPEFNMVGRKSRVEMARYYVEGQHDDDTPRFLISPDCPLAIEAFSSAYRYPEETTGGSDREMPDTSRKIQEEPYIHIMDSFEYMVACNLQVVNPTPAGHSKPQNDEELVTDLASAYLGAVPSESGRVASRPLADTGRGGQDLEVTLSELIGEDSLEDAWSLR